MKVRIKSKKQYHEIIVEIYNLMNKGEKNLTKKELTQLSLLSNAAEKYEEDLLGLKPDKELKTISEDGLKNLQVSIE